MIVLGTVLIVLGALLPLPPIVETLGIALLIIGAILWFLGVAGHPLGGRRWY